MTLTPKNSLLAVILAAASGLAVAQHSGHSPAASPSAAPPAAAAPGALPWAEAEVRRVDAGAGAVTLRHGDIRNLDMPPMTMVFKARNPAILNGIKAGDKVRFTADQINGTYTVLSIEPRP